MQRAAGEQHGVVVQADEHGGLDGGALELGRRQLGESPPRAPRAGKRRRSHAPQHGTGPADGTLRAHLAATALIAVPPHGPALAVACGATVPGGALPPEGLRAEALTARSRALSSREPCQIRKEAALSDLAQATRSGLARVAVRPAADRRTRLPGRSLSSGRRSRIDCLRGLAVSHLPSPHVRGRGGSGSHRAHARERGRAGPHRACLPVLGPARNGQDVAREDPREGAQLRERADRDARRHVPDLPAHPRCDARST